MFLTHASLSELACVCVRERERGRERGGGKLNAHGNLVSLRKKGGLGEVCFLLDLENVTVSFPSPPSVCPSLSLSLSHLLQGLLTSL